MNIAYVRVSTVEQNEGRQLEGLKPYGIDKWFTEKISAKDTNRPAGEYVRKDGPQHVSGVEELFDTSGVHAFDDGLFALGAFTENGLARRLLDGDG